MNKSVTVPFFVINPKSYLYGDELLQLAQKADQLAKKYDVTIFITAPYADISAVSHHTNHLIVTAQHMDGISCGRGMGAVLPESIHHAGAKAVFLNHAEHPLSLSALVASIEAAKRLSMITIVCADSLKEAKAVAELSPDILLCEPTELIGKGKTSDISYMQETTRVIREIDPDILVMQAAGIHEAADVYKVISLQADGTGCTSGIVCAKQPLQAVEDMIKAMVQAYEERSDIHD